MKLFWMCAVTIVAANGFETLPAAEKEAADPVWHQDYAAAKIIARKTNKALFVVFR